jgi:hypothetical protein
MMRPPGIGDYITYRYSKGTMRTGIVTAVYRDCIHVQTTRGTWDRTRPGAVTGVLRGGLVVTPLLLDNVA